jgi:hypothetical protein
MKKNFLAIVLILLSAFAFSQTLNPKGIRVGKKTSTTIGVIDSISTNDGKFKVYKGSQVLNAVNADTVAFSSIGVYKKDTVNSITGSYTSRYDFKTEYTNLNLIRGLNELNYGIKYLPFADFAIGSGNSLTDGRQYFTAFRITDTTTLTGVKFAPSVAGDYTSDNTNSVALYKWNGTSFDKVAETPNNGAMWKATANVVSTVAFAALYVAAPGWYYVSHVYNSSSQVTAPSLYAMEPYQAWFVDIGTFKLGGYIATRNTHAANVTPASITRNNIPFFFMIY